MLCPSGTVFLSMKTAVIRFSLMFVDGHPAGIAGAEDEGVERDHAGVVNRSDGQPPLTKQRQKDSGDRRAADGGGPSPCTVF